MRAVDPALRSLRALAKPGLARVALHALRAPATAAFVIAALLVSAQPVAAERRDWTGSAACGACHPQQLAAWKATPHASTAARLPQRPEGKCLACHGTGEAPAGTALAVEVGCEMCHGAGAAYAEDDIMRNAPVARALGLIDVSTPKARAAVCAQCHTRATRARPFDPTAPVHPTKKP